MSYRQKQSLVDVPVLSVAKVQLENVRVIRNQLLEPQLVESVDASLDIVAEIDFLKIRSHEGDDFDVLVV